MDCLGYDYSCDCAIVEAVTFCDYVTTAMTVPVSKTAHVTVTVTVPVIGP